MSALLCRSVVPSWKVLTSPSSAKSLIFDGWSTRRMPSSPSKTPLRMNFIHWELGEVEDLMKISVSIINPRVTKYPKTSWRYNVIMNMNQLFFYFWDAILNTCAIQFFVATIYFWSFPQRLARSDHIGVWRRRQWARYKEALHHWGDRLSREDPRQTARWTARGRPVTGRVSDRSCQHTLTG